IIVFLVVVYRLNTRWDRERIKPVSLVEVTRQAFESKIALLEPEPGAKTFNSLNAGNQRIPGFTIDYPATWSARLIYQAKDSVDPLAVLFSPANPSEECIRLWQSNDNMPILEVKNYNLFMLEKPGVPYLTKFDAIGTDVETTLDKMDVLVSKMRLVGTNSAELVDNAILVKDNTYSYILRGCLGTAEDIFYRAYKSFKLQY
ncbi:hypothetical protein KKD62_00005, partial [Patescibacteria group bacterium]|nr:hypothetical protein [Patescibacteria group bacterium]MBU1931912.1 hypothetical protein [Patescibacteria group bacterium]